MDELSGVSPSPQLLASSQIVPLVLLNYPLRVWKCDDAFLLLAGAFVVCLPRQRASGTVFGHPTLRGLIIQKVEAQNADMDGSPFSIVEGPHKVSATDLALPMKECAATNRDLLLGPQMSSREMIPRRSRLTPPFQIL